MKKKNEPKLRKGPADPTTVESSDEFAITTTPTTTTTITVANSRHPRQSNTRTSDDSEPPGTTPTIEPDPPPEGNPVAADGPIEETYPAATGTDPALAARLESLERAVQNLIQYTEASRQIPNSQAGDGSGGWANAINGIGNFLSKLVGPEQASGESSFMARMMDMTFNHYTMLDAVLAKQYGIPPPIQHMIIKQ